VSKKKLTKAERKAEGFHDVEKVELVTGEYSIIEGMGKVLRNNLKSIAQESIDALNEQQINTLILYRKKGTKYKLEERTKIGRVYPNGHKKEGQLMPYKYFIEDGDIASTSNDEDNDEADLSKLGRKDLDAMAEGLGIDDPAGLANKGEVIEAIEAAQAS